MSQLEEKYKKSVLPLLMKELGYKNVFAVPRIEKVVINTGIGRFSSDEKAVADIMADLTAITGQKPVFTLSKKAIAGFKVRQGVKVGIAVTLRGGRAYDFVERFIGLALPRSRDFRGIDRKSVDQNGTLNYGIKEQIIFPEIAERLVFIDTLF